LVNLDWSTTFTPMPVAASTRETVQIHIGAAMLQKDPDKYLSMDFGALLETMALTAGIKVSSENKRVLSGLEDRAVPGHWEGERSSLLSLES
jgi:3-hydroxyisobutyrate dehydrogenase